jgi:hypothetical protein
MMIRVIAVNVFLTGFVACQLNAFVFYPQDPERQTITCTSYVGRPNGNLQAEAMMELTSEHFRGIGDANSYSLVWGAYHWIADENLSTSETYDIVWRSGSLGGPGPDMSAQGEFARISGLTTPPSSSTARGTWITYEGFWHPTPVGLPLLITRLYIGVDLPANPLWPATDGHSLFRADLLSANTGATLGENERPGAPDPTWGGSVGGPAYSTPWSYILGPLVSSPNLHVGGIDPLSNRLGASGANLGMNGLYPDVSGSPRSDGLMIRVTDSQAPSSLVMLGAQYGFRPRIQVAQASFLSIGGSYIGDGSTAIPLGMTMLHTSSVDVTIALPNTISSAMIGTGVVFQGIVWDAAQLPNWTNAQIAHF